MYEHSFDENIILWIHLYLLTGLFPIFNKFMLLQKYHIIKIKFEQRWSTNNINISPHDEHWSCGQRLVKLCLSQYIFQFLFRTM